MADDDITQQVKVSAKNNPFSYKKFVNKRHDVDTVRDPSNSRKVSDGDSVPFPDLEGDAMTQNPPPRREDNPFSFKKFMKEKKPSHDHPRPGTNSFTTKRKNVSDESDENSVDSNSDSHGDSDPGVPFPAVDLQHQIVTDLPPLLEPPLIINRSSSSDSSEDGDDDHAIPFHNHMDEKVVEQLKTEKQQLTEELVETRHLLSKEKKRCEALEKKVKILKEKEKQEAQALATMVQKAEANLKLTTDRAVLAESKVAKLRKEVQSLQTRLAKQQGASHDQHYEGIFQTVRDKASCGAQQITQSADKAESMLKDLLTGVQSLRQLSDVLMSIDKIAELKEPTDS